MINLFFEYVKDKIKDIPCSIYLDLTVKHIKIENFMEYMDKKYQLKLLFFNVINHISSNNKMDTTESYHYLINNKVYFKFNTMSLQTEDNIIVSDMIMYSNLLNSEVSLDINNYIMGFDELAFNRKQKIEKISKK